MSFGQPKGAEISPYSPVFPARVFARESRDPVTLTPSQKMELIYAL